MIVNNKTLLNVACLLFAFNAQAGSRQAEQRYFTPDELASFSKKVERYVAGQGARVFLLARNGRPAEDLPEGVNYTHVGIGVYSKVKSATGELESGYMMYNLYIDSDDESRSNLVNDFVFDFFAGATELKAGVLIPNLALQKRLYQVVTSDNYAKLHNASYSTLSNPYNARYQNCTEFVLDVVNAAIYKTTDVAQLKANARAYFNPTDVRMSRLKLSLGAMFMEELRLDDHQGKVRTATFGSISDYLQRYELVSDVQMLQ